MEPDVYTHATLDQALALLELQPARPRATTNARFRHSNAGACTRQIAFAALDTPTTDPPDASSLWVMRVGTIIHDDIQAAWAELFPSIVLEGVVEWEHGAGHADGILPDGRTATIELKTMGAAGFDIATGIWRDWRAPKRKEAKGPKAAHLLQGALNAKCAGSDELVIAYLCLDPVSRRTADKLFLSDRQRYSASWTFSRDEFLPWADAEQARVARVLASVDAGVLPVATVPEDVAGTTRMIRTVDDRFPCGWCDFRSLCAQLSVDEVKINTFGGDAA